MGAELGNQLETLRRSAGLSRADGAQKSGVSRMTLFRWERGDNIPRDYELRAVLDAYGVSVPQRREALKAREDAALARLVLSGRRTPPPQTHLGDLLAALRGRAGFTQAELAARAGVPRFSLTAWENLHSWPDDAALHCLAYALNATETELLALTAPPTQQTTSDDRSRDALYHDANRMMWGWPPLAQSEPEILRLIARLRPLAPQEGQGRSLLTELTFGYSVLLTYALRPQESARWRRRAEASGANPHAPYLLAWRTMAHSVTLKEGLRRASPARRRRSDQELYEEQRRADDAIDGMVVTWRVTHRMEMAATLQRLGEDDSALRLAASAFALTTAERTQPEARLSRYGEILHATHRHDIIADLFPAYLGRSAFADAHIRYYLGLATRAHGDEPAADALLHQALAEAQIHNRPLLERDIRQSLLGNRK